MEQPSNIEILKQFTLSQDEQIFAAIVVCYVDLVFSAALRQLHDWHLAEETTQSVFLDLLKAAPKLPTQTILGAWLHQVTRRRCLDMIRAEKRRRNRERIAADMQNNQTDQTCWKQIEWHLEEALESLSEKEYNAVILRFFEDKNHREVGKTLGISEDAAQKRIQRAVQHLSSFLGKRGLGVGVTTLTSLLLDNTIQAAPPGLSPSILTAANLFGTGLVTTTAASATQAITMTTLQKAVATSVVTISLGVGIYAKQEASQLEDEIRQLQTTRAETMKDQQGALAEKTSLLEEAQNEIERLKDATADIHRLRSDIRHGAQSSSFFGQQTPVVIGWFEQPILKIGSIHMNDLPEGTFGNFAAKLKDRWIETHIVVQGEHLFLGSFCFLADFQRFFGGHGKRLFAYHVFACFQRRHRLRMMGSIGRGDMHHVYLIRLHQMINLLS
ncbi:MAG: sigma-70 family RNA polymerase sigma factor [Verrucomicrobia bacterium]|nr:sigma-70 family RNA polymerase sigma factor [Verrucomicrobiota bacterium]